MTWHRARVFVFNDENHRRNTMARIDDQIDSEVVDFAFNKLAHFGSLWNGKPYISQPRELWEKEVDEALPGPSWFKIREQVKPKAARIKRRPRMPKLVAPMGAQTVLIGCGCKMIFKDDLFIGEILCSGHKLKPRGSS